MVYGLYDDCNLVNLVCLFWIFDTFKLMFLFHNYFFFIIDILMENPSHHSNSSSSSSSSENEDTKLQVTRV